MTRHTGPIGASSLRRLVVGSVLGAVPWAPCSSEAQQQAAAPAAGGADENAQLAKKLSNPVSDLVSVPFQFNWEQGVGPGDDTRFVLNVQPVMPFSLNKDLNLITRHRAPGEPASALRRRRARLRRERRPDVVSPASGGSLTWGVGPVVSLPSTSIPTLGTDMWSVGPTAVVLKQSGPWTIGVLWNQVWSIGGSESREDVSQMFVQPFIARQVKSWTITLQSETTANWKAEDDKWTVPVNLLFAKLSSFGPFPASYQSAEECSSRTRTPVRSGRSGPRS